MVTLNLFPTNQAFKLNEYFGTETPTPNPFGHCDRCRMLYNFVIVVQPGGYVNCNWHTLLLYDLLYHIIMNKTRTNRVNRNIYLTPKPQKLCQAFFSCIYLVDNVLIKFSTSFHLGGLSCTFVAGRSHFKATWHNK